MEHGVHGELVGDDGEMAASISGLLLDRGRLMRLAEGARRPVSHAWEAALQRCDDLYARAGCQTSSHAQIVAQHRGP